MVQAELTQVREQHKEPFYWLNEDSKEFLREGYLIEGVEPKERIRQIAENAEEILDEEGFADRFYDYMSRGFSTVSQAQSGRTLDWTEASLSAASAATWRTIWRVFSTPTPRSVK
jgi:hypothetical protein